MTDIARGAPVDVVCAEAGIHRDTFYSWLDQRPEFARKLAAEKKRFILELLTEIRSCTTKGCEFRNLTWLLERIYPEAFAPKPPNVAFFEQNNFLTEEKSRELSDRARQLMQDHDIAESHR